MRRGLYPILAGTLVAVWLLAEIFRNQINTASPILQALLIGMVSLIAIGVLVLAAWDTKIIGRKKDRG